MVPFKAVMAAPACLCVLAAAHGVLHRDPPPAPVTPWLWHGQTNAADIPFADGKPLFPALVPAANPELEAQVLPPAARLHPPSVLPRIPPGVYRGAASNHFVVPPTLPKVRPGIYKTEPYSCIVVVPGPHPDDRCIINPGRGNYSMPIIRPELRFIPLTPAPTR